MEYVLRIISHKFNCIFCCIFCISKILKNKTKLFEKKIIKESKKTAIRKAGKLAYFFMIDFSDVFCSNSVGVLFWKAMKGISYRDPLKSVCMSTLVILVIHRNLSCYSGCMRVTFLNDNFHNLTNSCVLIFSFD